MAGHLPIVGGHTAAAATSCRTDKWWTHPLATFLGLSVFLGYGNWAMLQGQHFTAGPYLSPLYSPVLFVPPSGEGIDHAWIGPWPSWWPEILPASPALLILIIPLSLRFTCYYYRKAYYRSFAGSPLACGAVPIAIWKRYRGETHLLVIQNLHRYALYLSLCYIPILYYDGFLALFYKGQFGVGVGTFVLFTNATLIALYTFGCHSLRHLVGGQSDCMSCGQQTLKFRSWKLVSLLNRKHMNFAWASLAWVMFTDLYVRLCSIGIITDLNTW